MKRSIIFRFLVAVLCAAGCTSEKVADVPECHLTGTVMKTDEIIGTSLQEVTDTSLVAIQYDQECMSLYEIEGDSLKLRRQFAYKGRGPHEFIFMTVKMRKDGVLDVINSGSYGDLMSLQSVSIEDLWEGKPMSEMWEESDLSWMENFFFGGDFTLAEDGRYYFLGDNFGTANLITAVDLRDRKREGLGYWIEDKYEGPVLPKQGIYLANSGIFSHGDKLLYVCGENRYAELLTVSSGAITERKVLYGDHPIYSAAPDGLNYRLLPENHRGIRACVTDSLIYLRLDESDVRMLPYKGYSWYYGDEIEVYDWAGNHLKRYITDRPFHTMKVSEGDSLLYTVTKDLETEEPIIMRYRM